MVPLPFNSGLSGLVELRLPILHPVVERKLHHTKSGKEMNMIWQDHVTTNFPSARRLPRRPKMFVDGIIGEASHPFPCTNSHEDDGWLVFLDAYAVYGMSSLWRAKDISLRFVLIHG